MEHLRLLDVAGCPNFIGISFTDAQENWAPKKLAKVILGKEFSNCQLMKVTSKRLKEINPNIIIELNARKSFEQE